MKPFNDYERAILSELIRRHSLERRKEVYRMLAGMIATAEVDGKATFQAVIPEPEANHIRRVLTRLGFQLSTERTSNEDSVLFYVTMPAFNSGDFV